MATRSHSSQMRGRRCSRIPVRDWSRRRSKRKFSVVPVPGASALLSALVASGIAADQFTFLGFIARKGAERDGALRTIARSAFTTVLYESPQRIAATLDDLINAGCGERPAAIARELTKKFEEVRRGTVASLHADMSGGVRGEIVLVIAGAVERAPTESEARETVSRMRSEGASSRDIIERLTASWECPEMSPTSSPIRPRIPLRLVKFPGCS